MIMPVAEVQLGMGDFSALPQHHHLPRKAESGAQPIDGCRRLAVAQRRNDSPSEACLLLNHHLVP
jgi:hypothetical protein